MAKKVLSGELRGERRTPRRGGGTLFRDHKTYAQGDDLRFVDWNAYSRLGELLVKQFEAEENLDLLIFVDRSASMDYGESSKIDCARKLAAALSFIALERHATVEIATLPVVARAAPQRFFGKSRLVPLLSCLESLRAGGTADFFADIRAGLGRRRGRGVAVVLSDFLSEAGPAPGLRFLRHAGFRVAAVQILDRLDLRPDVAGLSRLVDLESGASLRRNITRDMLDRYEREARAICEGLQRFCRAQDVAHSRIDSSWSMERSVRALLLSGGLLG